MKEILDFLAELSCNNNREWFNEHKDWYKDCHLRFELFTAQWLERLATIDPDLANLQPKDCIWRIYRDVRFSHDKRPFKEWFGVFPAVKGGKKHRQAHARREGQQRRHSQRRADMVLLYYVSDELE